MSSAEPSWWRVLSAGAYLCAAWAVVLPLLWCLSARDWLIEREGVLMVVVSILVMAVMVLVAIGADYPAMVFGAGFVVGIAHAQR